LIFPLRAVVDQAVALLGERAAIKSVMLDLQDSTPMCLSFVLGDPTPRVRQVSGGPGRSLKFTDHGGRLSVACTAKRTTTQWNSRSKTPASA
jgi:hypothetical protein